MLRAIAGVGRCYRPTSLTVGYHFPRAAGVGGHQGGAHGHGLRENLTKSLGKRRVDYNIHSANAGRHVFAKASKEDAVFQPETANKSLDRGPVTTSEENKTSLRCLCQDFPHCGQ